MPKRSEALYQGRIIGIESIFTVIDGKQINIPEKLKDMREKSRRNELFCPCGCGNNLILVAGDKNLREQHFREKHSEEKYNCEYEQEGVLSVYSKIVLKCWLDDKLKVDDIEDHVPISDVDDTNRRYEFSFLSRSKRLAVNYCRKRENLSDEKLGILEANAKGIRVIHVVDSANADNPGQYPEGLMKVQNHQGYCLLLKVEDYDYFKASMKAMLYARDLYGVWKELPFAEGKLTSFDITDDGAVLFWGQPLEQLLVKVQERFEAEQLAEQKRLNEWEEKMRRRREELESERKRMEEEAERARQEQEQEGKAAAARLEEERREQKEAFNKQLEEGLVQQETKVFDPDGNRWFRCEYCGKIAMESEFPISGGIGRINLGTCKACVRKERDRVKSRKE